MKTRLETNNGIGITDIVVGECFLRCGRVCMKIPQRRIGTYLDSLVNAVALETGELIFVWADELIEALDAEVIAKRR